MEFIKLTCNNEIEFLESRKCEMLKKMLFDSEHYIKQIKNK